MNPADEPHRSRRQRRLIVAEKRARPRQRDGDIVCVKRLPKISYSRCWRILRAKNAKHKSRTVNHRNNHIYIRGVHGRLHDLLHVRNLQGRHWRNRRRSNRRCAPASASRQQRGQRSRKPQRQQNPKHQRFFTLVQGAPRREWLPKVGLALHEGYLPY